MMYSLSGYAQDNFYDISKIREVRLFFKDKNWDAILDSLFLSGETDARLAGDAVIDGKFFKNVGVRYKGFSSANVDYKKNPFNIDLDYAFPNQNYQGYTKIKLSNVIHDPSFVREVLSYEISRKYMIASRANFANVYVNDTLMGLYTNVEAVDKDFAERQFGSRDHSFFKGSPETLEFPFGQNANLAYTHGTDSAGYIPYYKIESDYGWNELLHFIDILNNDSSRIEEVLNVDQALWMHAFNYCLLNLDSYIGYAQNYYLYRDNNGLFNTIPWDFNMSLGSFRRSDGSTNFLGLTIAKLKVLDPLQHLNFSVSPRPLMTEIFKNDTYRRQYLAHMRSIMRENIENGLYYQRTKQLQALVDEAVQQDNNKFESYTRFLVNADTTTGGGTPDECPGIRDLMEARLEYLETYPGFSGEPGISEIGHSPELPARSDQVWITARIQKEKNVTLYYRTNSHSTFSKSLMYDNGNCHDGNAGDHIYGAGFPAPGQIIQYYIYAENDSAGTFSPERAAYEFYSLQPQLKPGELVINEIMADNRNAMKSPVENHQAWIELFNTSKEIICLKNIFLSDDPLNMSKWTFPDTLLPAGGYLVIGADGDTSQAGLQSSFSLNKEGGLLYLSDATAYILDSVMYDRQPAGISMGRSPNGYGPFSYMNPSPGKYNELILQNTDELIVFPNPARSELYIQIQHPEGKNVLEIFNVNAQKIYSEEWNMGDKPDGYIMKQLNVSNYAKGIYLIRHQSDTEELKLKFIVY